MKAPDELYAQLGMVKDLLRTFGVAIFEKEGFVLSQNNLRKVLKIQDVFWQEGVKNATRFRFMHKTLLRR